MGEAMAGVMNSGRHAHAWLDGDEKSDHFVGPLLRRLRRGRRLVRRTRAEHPEDSLTRELTLHDDEADELLKRVLGGDREALELW